MESNREIFADGIGEITLVGGMVRIDLVSLSPHQKDEKDNPVLEYRGRIVMPPDGFLRSFSAMENLVNQLVEAGVIQKNAGGVGGSDDGSPPPRATPEPPKSPNF